MGGAKDGFFQRVYDIVAAIPEGKVASYGGIARMLGNPRAARQVGWAMRACPGGLPWQRVVRADGGISIPDWREAQRGLLEDEGVAFTADGRVDMARFEWDYGAGR